jgi:hypothetical protein
MSHFAFPYRISADGRTAETSIDEHIRLLIALVLFTNQGERVNRPDFGSGVKQLVFAENAPELATALQHIVHSNLQRWLSEKIEVRGVDVQATDATLAVVVRYRMLDSDEEKAVRLVRQA